MRLAALPEVMVQYIGDEAVIPNAKTRACVGLDPVGTCLWQLLNESPSIDAALASFLEEYDVSEERLRKDVEDFIENLVRNGMVEIPPAG